VTSCAGWEPMYSTIEWRNRRILSWIWNCVFAGFDINDPDWIWTNIHWITRGFSTLAEVLVVCRRGERVSWHSLRALLPPIHQTGNRINGTHRYQQPQQQEQYRTVWRKQFAVVASTYKRHLANAPKFVGVSDRTEERETLWQLPVIYGVGRLGIWRK